MSGLDDLNPKQKACVEYYIDPKSPSFGIKSRSYQRAYGCKKSTAEVQGCLLLNNPRIQEIMSEEIGRRGYGLVVRLDQLIATARGERPSETVVHDRDGNVVSRTRAYLVRDQLKAMEMVNEFDPPPTEVWNEADELIERFARGFTEESSEDPPT